MQWVMQPFEDSASLRAQREAEIAALSINRWMAVPKDVDLRVLGNPLLKYRSMGKVLSYVDHVGIDVHEVSSSKGSTSVNAKVVVKGREQQSQPAPLKDRPLVLLQRFTDRLQERGWIREPNKARSDDYVKVRVRAVCGGMSSKVGQTDHWDNRRVVWWAGQAPGISVYLAGNVENLIVDPGALLADGGAPIHWDPSGYMASGVVVDYLIRSAQADADIGYERLPEEWATDFETIFDLCGRRYYREIEDGWYDILFRCDKVERSKPEQYHSNWSKEPQELKGHVSMIGSPFWVVKVRAPQYGWYHIGPCHADCDAKSERADFYESSNPAGYYAEWHQSEWTGNIGLYCGEYPDSRRELREFCKTAIPPSALSELSDPDEERAKFRYWITCGEQERRGQQRDRASALERDLWDDDPYSDAWEHSNEQFRLKFAPLKRHLVPAPPRRKNWWSKALALFSPVAEGRWSQMSTEGIGDDGSF
ncbi:hypothetical protein Srot_2360 [Segniliparus rotundus DSM 44985]|uniref:Uncharacterized protein n=1 Tax=Segniliparus rotundus (strain ATCC BAA-972 / CDC 1076 / CIP 108378 / DSM 44985 / JCM 13578) TaxID=640132 RepID=D6ZAS2_SEGRD|nr:hypothetical protein [Segniliparus rotundus]ADG98808.1 hypothetical protein Srot_2360 [Segniliparus rotundus DSM 44985]